MKETFICEDDVWSIQEKPPSSDYPGLTYVLEDGAWNIEEENPFGNCLKTIGKSGADGSFKLQRDISNEIGLSWTMSFWFKPTSPVQMHWPFTFERKDTGLEFGIRDTGDDDWSSPNCLSVYETTGNNFAPEREVTYGVWDEYQPGHWDCYTLAKQGNVYKIWHDDLLTYTTDPDPVLFAGNPKQGDTIHMRGIRTPLFANGYIARLLFMETVVAPSSFGERDDNNNYRPKKYEGSYGPNGFEITFADPNDLGRDYSGNDNHWTVSGFTSADVEADDIKTSTTARQLEAQIAANKIKMETMKRETENDQ